MATGVDDEGDIMTEEMNTGVEDEGVIRTDERKEIWMGQRLWQPTHTRGTQRAL